MNQSFYTGAVGAHQQMLRLGVHGNNFANVNSYGFKAEKPRFTALLYRNIRGVEEDAIPSGVGTRLLMTSTDFTAGYAATTGINLDYMIDGEGFFALVDLNTSEVTFTRNGSFSKCAYQRETGQVDENGEPIMEQVFCLSDNEGRFVLSREGGLIEVNDTTVDLPIGIFDYNNYNGMVQLDGTRFLPVDKNGNLWMGSGKLIRGTVELSNTDLADEMTKVIESQRAYGMALKVVQTSDEIETTINNLR